MGDFSNSVNMGSRKDMHKNYAKLTCADVVTIFPYAQRGQLVSCNVSTPSAISIMEVIYYALVDLGEISPTQKEVKQNTTEYHSFLPDPPHPFLFTLDALIADSAMGKETRKRLEVTA
jgi:hypothetical protein